MKMNWTRLYSMFEDRPVLLSSIVALALAPIVAFLFDATFGFRFWFLSSLFFLAIWVSLARSIGFHRSMPLAGANNPAMRPKAGVSTTYRLSRVATRAILYLVGILIVGALVLVYLVITGQTGKPTASDHFVLQEIMQLIIVTFGICLLFAVIQEGLDILRTRERKERP